MRDLFFVLLFIFFGVAGALGQAETKPLQYKRFPETVSPDGAYFLAWGAKLPKDADPETLVEVPYKTPLNPTEMEVQDYLAETKRTHPPVALPKCEYFSAEEGHEKGRGLSYAWSPDSKGVLVVYESEEGYVSSMWAAPLEQSVFNIGLTLEKELRGLVTDRFGLAEEVSRHNVFFTRYAVLEPGLLTIDGCLTQLTGQLEKPVSYWFRMRFRIKAQPAAMLVELVSSRILNAEDLAADEPPRKGESLDTQLDRVLADLNARVAPANKEALRKQHALWLKQREAFTNPATRVGFTRHRLEELAIRAAEARVADRP